MLSRRVLLNTPELRVVEVHCAGYDARWSAPELVSSFAIVLPRRGVFRRRVGSAEVLVDPTTGYVQVPGTEQEIAHPAGGDVCTSVAMAGAAEVPGGAVHLTPRAGLAHRLLLTRARAGADEVELADLATEVVAAVLGGAPVAGRRLVDAAREILAADPQCPLPELALRLAVSPSHLSRVFHSTMGITLRRYRIRLRTVAALERLGGGPRSLAAVAAELGFADQAHLTRTMTAETGQPPGRLRALLSRETAPTTSHPTMSSRQPFR